MEEITMWYIILIIVILLLLAFSAFMYFRTKGILAKLDAMLESAINHTLSENAFTEERLSKLESKMYRYLSAGEMSIRQLNTEKDKIKALISDISHQTKTPISNILLYTQLLSEAEELTENTRALVRQIERQSEKLNFLIASLIKTSRLENGIVSVTPKRNSINKLLACIDYKSLANQKGIHFHVENTTELSAFFDFKWTLEAITNIVDNALKYTPPGGTVSVNVQCYEMFVRIDITDSGIGMTEDETAKIFTRFYRSPHVSDVQGVGIGLFLAREILSKEGGYIKVSSKIDHGSTFSIFLPNQENLSKV